MADLNLTQAEASRLLAIEKAVKSDDEVPFPGAGEGVVIELESKSSREEFLLDFHRRGKITLKKATYQTRFQKAIILARVDLNGPAHKNPDGTEFPTPHLHVYREGYGDKWAMALPDGAFSDPADLHQTLMDFCSYCNVTKLPNLPMPLFI